MPVLAGRLVSYSRSLHFTNDFFSRLLQCTFFGARSARTCLLVPKKCARVEERCNWYLYSFYVFVQFICSSHGHEKEWMNSLKRKKAVFEKVYQWNHDWWVSFHRRNVWKWCWMCTLEVKWRKIKSIVNMPIYPGWVLIDIQSFSALI